MLSYYKRKELSMFMSKLLRHEPSLVNITLDKNGWVDINIFYEKINNIFGDIKIEDIYEIVENDSKSRYSILDNKIRANQGHNRSLNVNIDFKEIIPTNNLYHGTIDLYIDSIKSKGLIAKNRQYVHLTNSIKIATSVAKRRKNLGKVVIIEIDVERMIKDGYKFYISDNNVYLTRNISNIYFKSFLYL